MYAVQSWFKCWDKTLHPARRISCNLAGQILLIQKSGEMRICEIEIYSLSSLQHTATIQTQKALESPSSSQITQSFDDLAKFIKVNWIFEFTSSTRNMKA